MESDMIRKLALAAFVATVYTQAAYATDARISYKLPSGQVMSAVTTAPVCGVNDDGTASLCQVNPSIAAGTSGLISYKNTDGSTSSALPTVPVCSVDSDGVPQICDFSGGSSDLSAYLTTSAAAQTYIPLVQVGANSGVAGLDSAGNMTAPVKTSGASSTGALSVTGNLVTTNSSGYIQGAVSGTTQKWGIYRSVSGKYTILNTYNGSSWAPFTFNDDGTMDSTVGVFANLGADAPFSGLVSASSLKSTGDSEFGGNVSLDNGKALTFHGPSGTSAASSYMYGDGNGNISVAGSMAIPSLSVATSAYVPDTTTTDSTTAALNTESAAARFLDKSTASATYQSIQDMDIYVRTVSGSLTKPIITQATLSGATSIDDGKIMTDGNGNLSVSTGLKAPTPATTDNSTSVATTAFVNNAFSSIEYSVTGDISTSGSSISIPFGTSGLYATFAYTGSGSASMSFYSSSGTLSPVDIRRNSIWGGSGVETYTLDNGSVGTAGVVADSTVYTQSQDSSAYFIRVGGTVYFLTVWASNNGARAFMGVHKMI